MTTRDARRVAATVGPYALCLLVLWRMRWWEVKLTEFVRAGHRVMDAASADLAGAATELHEEAVTRGAQQN